MLRIEKNWENPSLLHVNREAPRAYYIPYADASAAAANKRGARKRLCSSTTATAELAQTRADRSWRRSIS